MSEQSHNTDIGEDPTRFLEDPCRGVAERSAADTTRRVHARPSAFALPRREEAGGLPSALSGALDSLASVAPAVRLRAAREIVSLCRNGDAIPAEVLPGLLEAYRSERSVRGARDLLSLLNRVRCLDKVGAARSLLRLHPAAGLEQHGRAWALLQHHLEDRYSVEGRISATRMSEVYRGWRRSDGQAVAIKCLPERLSSDVTRGDFARETEVLMRLRHPHIVPVLDRGLAGELPYLVMPYVDGGSLRDLRRGPPPAVARALRIGAEVCEALGYIHSHGVMHLDLKPGNVLLNSSDRAQLADFGIARALGGGLAVRPGGVTPRYAAPEQLAPAGHLDHRTDVYSLAVVLYQLLTGRLPGHLVVPASTLNRRAPASLDGVLARALQHDLDRRFRDGASFRAALLECLPAYMTTGARDDARMPRR